MKKINSGLKISTAAIYFARFGCFPPKDARQTSPKKFNILYSYTRIAPIMTYLGLGGSKSPTLKNSWVPLLLVIIFASNMGSIAQWSWSNHVPYFYWMSDPWDLWLADQTDWKCLGCGSPSGYEILVQRPCLLKPKGEKRWTGEEVSYRVCVSILSLKKGP